MTASKTVSAGETAREPVPQPAQWRRKMRVDVVPDGSVQRFARVLSRITDASLTPTECVVLYLRIVEMRGNTQIATRTVLSTKTVETHLARIRAKLGCGAMRRAGGGSHSWAEPLIASYWREVGRDDPDSTGRGSRHAVARAS